MSKTPMSLVMFKFAIEHISRVARVLKQDNGHALLVGKHLDCCDADFSETNFFSIECYKSKPMLLLWHICTRVENKKIVQPGNRQTA